ncbi:MAG: hypothetical protein FJZ01_21450 [Candidatus Sericytochromatia bacterium]|nr:hypothetical protein [Candidatus Tanganyikabacteria bacterium]
MKLSRVLVAFGLGTVLAGADLAEAATKRYERGPEKVTVATEKGQPGVWVEYEQYTYESAADRIAGAAKGKLTDAELARLQADVKKGGKSLTAAEVQAKINAIVAARPKPKPAPKGRR